MKKRLIVTLILSIMIMTLVGCKEKAQDGNSTVDTNSIAINNDEENKDKEENKEEIKITKDEAIKNHDKILSNLKALYDANGLPYRVDNTYNQAVEESELIFNSSKAEAEKIDIKNIDRAEYDFTDEFLVDAFIKFKWEESMDLNNNIAKEYCKAILDEDIDFKEIMTKVNEYIKENKDSAVDKDFSQQMNIGKYTVKVSMPSITELTVFIKSDYKVK